MKVTFSHPGSMHIFCKAIAETAGEKLRKELNARNIVLFPYGLRMGPLGAGLKDLTSLESPVPHGDLDVVSVEINVR